MKRNKGFTLVELMVVIAIIAILAVIAFSVYSNAQKSARDAKRRSEIDAIAKSLETLKNFNTMTYAYSATNYAADFPTGAPIDPTGGQVGVTANPDASYCMATSTTVTPPNAPTAWAATGVDCPTAPAGYAIFPELTTGVPIAAASNIKAWRICAKLEVDQSFFCKASLSN